MRAQAFDYYWIIFAMRCNIEKFYFLNRNIQLHERDWFFSYWKNISIDICDETMCVSVCMCVCMCVFSYISLAETHAPASWNI